MDPTRINWSRRIAEIISDVSDIPTDITFKFTKTNYGNDKVSAQYNEDKVSAQSNDDVVSAQSNEDEVSAQSNDDVVSAQSNEDEVSAQSNDDEDSVSAHKMILGLVSPMLRKMFYVHNTVDMFSREIIMEDTTAPAFRIFIDAIYSVTHIQESLNGKSVDEMFAVLYLVTKYDIPELVLAVQDTLSSFPLTMDTVLEIAADVMDYSTTFQEESNRLLLACAEFLKAKLTRANDVLRLIAENGDRLAVIHKLSVLIREITPPAEETVPGLVESSGEESEDEDSDEEVGDSEDSRGYLTELTDTEDSEVSDEESQETAGDSDSDSVEPSPPFEPQNDDLDAVVCFVQQASEWLQLD